MTFVVLSRQTVSSLMTFVVVPGQTGSSGAITATSRGSLAVTAASGEAVEVAAASGEPGEMCVAQTHKIATVITGNALNGRKASETPGLRITGLERSGTTGLKGAKMTALGTTELGCNGTTWIPAARTDISRRHLECLGTVYVASGTAARNTGMVVLTAGDSGLGTNRFRSTESSGLEITRLESTGTRGGSSSTAAHSEVGTT